IVTGTPSSGDSGRPARQRSSAARAAAAAPSRSTRYIALRLGSHASMRPRQARATSTGDTVRLAYRAASSAADNSCSAAIVFASYNCGPMRHLLVSLILLAGLQGPAHAQQEIQFWHAMGGALGDALESFVQRFNESQKEYRVVGTHKGSYEDTMIAALAAHRIGTGPHIVQVSEIGTGHVMAWRSAYVPAWQVVADAGESLEARSFIPSVAGYFSDSSGKLLALPFNLSTPILFYNKDTFRKAKLDPEKPVKSWYDLPKIVGELKEIGIDCALTTTWPSWVMLENMSTWHNQDFATKENGLGGLDAKLIFNTHIMVRHVSFLASWARA